MAGIDTIRKALEVGVVSGRTFRHESQVIHQSGDIAVLDCKSTVIDTAADGTVSEHEWRTASRLSVASPTAPGGS